MGFVGEFAWLTAMAACPWAAYAVSQAAYYAKAKAENKIKLKKIYQISEEEVEKEYKEAEEEVAGKKKEKDEKKSQIL